MIPTSQIRAVDPHSSYHSDNVNRISRVLTAGNDAIALDAHLLPTKESNTSIRIAAGVAVKDDVMLQIETDEFIDITNSDNYVEGALFSGSFPTYGYIVLEYQYVKQPVPPAFELKILKTISNFDTDVFIFLGRVDVVSATEIDIIQADDPGVMDRVVLNIGETYNDTRARAADATNPITNHAAAPLADKNKLVGTNATTGVIEFVDKGGLNYTEYDIDVGDYTAGWATITHNLGVRPGVQILDFTTKEVISPKTIDHINSDSFRIQFDEFDPTPHVIVLI